MRSINFWILLFLLFSTITYGDRTVFRTVPLDTPGSGTRLRNPGFEEGTQTPYAEWNFWMKGYDRASKAGRNASTGIICRSASLEEQHGASQSVKLNQDRPRTIIASGWSKAEGIDGAPDNGYSVYLDIEFMDGTSLFGQTSPFTTGNHDWELRRRIITPTKPIRTVTVLALFRGHRGTAYFDDFNVTELSNDAVLFDGRPIQTAQQDALNGSDTSHTVKLATRKGLSLTLNPNTGTVNTLKLHRKEIGSSLSATFVRDVAADSDFLTPDTWTSQGRMFMEGEIASLGIHMRVEYRQQTDYLEIEGRVEDMRGQDRAVTVYQALPVEGEGWVWSDDPRHDRPADQGTFINEVPTGAGATGTRSLYPFAALTGPKGGLGLAVPLNDPRHHRLAYNSTTKTFYAAFDLGLSRDTAKSPGAATYHLRIFSFEPRGRFRSALTQYHQMFKADFSSTLTDRGNWIAFTDVATIPQSEDFGFAYHEGTNNVAWDDAHAIRTFVYTEPMTTWMPMPKETPKTYEAAIAQLQAALNDPASKWPDASKTRLSAAKTKDGRYVVSVGDTPWCSGAVFDLDADPDLPTTTADPVNQGQYAFRQIEAAMKGAGTTTPPEVDGTYIDSYEFWATTFNYNRAHFASADIPLVFDAQSHDVGLLTVFSTFEFHRALAEKMHRQGKYIMANGVLNSFDFSASGLDVLGTETNWFPNGKWEPLSDGALLFRRALSYDRPYCFLLNAPYARLTLDDIERYMQRCLFYAMFPGFFSENAATDCFFQTPKWYEPARPLFKKYMPLIRMIEQAGWQPITNAHAEDPGILVEQYGASKDRLFFTLLNDTQQSIKTTLHVDAKGIRSRGGSVIFREQITDAAITPRRVGKEYICEIALPPQTARVLEVTCPSKIAVMN